MLKKCLVINIVVILILLFAAEFYAYKIELKKEGASSSKASFPTLTKGDLKSNWIKTFKKIEKNEINEIESGFRPAVITKDVDKQKGIVLLFGCSYAYGASLTDKQTFSYKLQKQTQRLVINRAFSGWGIQNMVYQLKLNDFKNHVFAFVKDETNSNISLKNDSVQYVIYLYMADHLRRLYVPCSFFDDKFISYSVKESTLKENGIFPTLYWYSYLLRSLYRSKFSYIENNYNDENKNYLLAHFIEANKEIKKNFPNAKFIIFDYSNSKIIKEADNELKNNGINTVYLSELSSLDFTTDEYVADKVLHPSEKAWDVIVPLFAKKLNL